MTGATSCGLGLWAIATTHSFAHLVDDITDATRYDPADFREQMEQGKLSLLFILGVGKPGYIEDNAAGRILSHDPNSVVLPSRAGDRVRTGDPQLGKPVFTVSSRE